MSSPSQQSASSNGDGKVRLPAAEPTDVSSPAEPEEGFNPGRLIGVIRRKVLVIFVAAIAMSAFSGFKSARQTPLFEGNFAILVQPVTPKQQLSTLTQGKGSDAPKEFDYSTQIEVLLSPKTLEQILKQIQERYPTVTYETLTTKMKIIRLGETKIIEISYSGTNPAEVKFVLEKISQGYLKYSLDDQKVTLRQGIKFIDEQMPGLRQKADSLQRQLQELRQAYNFVDPETYSQQLSSQINASSQQRQAIQAEIATMQARYNATQQQLGATAALNQAAYYQDFLKQFQALDRQIAIESARLGENSPTIKMLRQQQRNLEPLLRQEAKRALTNQLASLANEMQILNNRQQALAQTENQLSAKFKQMPGISRQFGDLQRESIAVTDSIKRFLDTRESLEIQAAQNEVPWQLITPPKDPQSKVVGNVYKSLVTGAVGGVIVGIVLAIILEKIQDSYYLVSDLKKKTRLPILGVIPYQPDLEQAGPQVYLLRQESKGRSLAEDMDTLKNRMKTLLSHHPEPTPAAVEETPVQKQTEDDAYGFLEAFRSLHAYLKRLGLSQPVRSIVISSALPVEGRTTVAVYLAHAAAAMGRRVLLVDAHLRRGSVPLHTLLGLPDKPGLSNFLNEEITLNASIQRPDWESNLFVVEAGNIPQDPTRLLSSARMQVFMEHVEKAFDLVIYDTLPLMGLADVNLLASHADGVILVAGFGKWWGVSALNQTLDRLKVAHIPVLGIVANGVRDYSVDLYSR